ncbi:hypothetical protein U0035_15510 [Niabella yanshanensis]|uniref:Lipoprotein n=1 Tax=Niabella yanshanensis TaxID=577386 RepID=A0ABZ0W3G3_9BACT|nr:hypothetical protein [Niabella yanshanensis]WQD37079.1 hypothetical protein U0035_15510 [Niabella yanshanensis]
MRPVFFILITVIFFACHNTPRQSETSSEDSVAITAEKTEPVVDAQCYLSVAAKDTYALKLTIIDTSVKGTAVFKNFEKDSNHGTLEGRVEGDIVRLWYNFQSEGMNSVRELYFKKEGDKWVTGVSNEATRADTAYVPDAKAVVYNGPVYIKGDCAAFPEL